ncbi:MAG: hypothetical protein ACHQD9_09585 [Chitinophagales bacterium]
MIIRKVSLLFVFVGVMSLASAQTEIPYSRFGIGILQDPEPAWMKGWGSLSAAFHNQYNINYMNPASYGYLNYTVFEAGMFGTYLHVKSNEGQSASFTDAGLSTFVFAFPVMKNKLGISFGLTPFSRVDYNIISNNDSVPGLGASTNNFNGNGGLYKFHLGAGYRWKGLSFGINAAYLFGKLDYSTILVFDNSLNAFNTLRDESRVFGDFVFTGGIQYRFTFGKDKDYFLDLGLDGDLKTNVAATRDLMYVRFTYYDANGFLQTSPQPKDTITNVHEKGEVVFPPRISGGITFSKQSHYMIGVDYDYAKWSEYSSFGEKDFTTNSWSIGSGFQYIPEASAYTEYYKVIAYRVGFSMGQNYLKFNDQNLLQYKASIGAGFPVKKVLSEVSFSAEWLKLGNLNSDPLAITNFRFTLGVTLNDRWFLKRKFD